MERSNKQIIVLGMMRSGTSLCAGMLSHLGIDMGDDRKRNSMNPRGYFEDKEIFVLNQQILGKNNDWHPPKSKKEISPLIPEIKDKKGLWGVKGGMNFTIDFYIPYLSNPHFVITYRNPISNIRSMAEYKGWDFDKNWELLLKHYKQLKRVIKKYPKIPKYYFEFERAKQNPIKVAQELADFIGIKNFNKKAIKDFVYVSRYKR